MLRREFEGSPLSLPWWLRYCLFLSSPWWSLCRSLPLFFLLKTGFSHIAHLSRPWSIGWVALSFLVRSFVVRPAVVTSDQISIFIGPESDHWLCLSLTHSLTHSLTQWLLFSGLDGCEWYQLLDDVATATESCDKLSKVEKVVWSVCHSL